MDSYCRWGVLPMVSDGVKEGIHKFVVPADNLMESRLVQGRMSADFVHWNR